jgi:hypothetical protein
MLLMGADVPFHHGYAGRKLRYDIVKDLRTLTVGPRPGPVVNPRFRSRRCRVRGLGNLTSSYAFPGGALQRMQRKRLEGGVRQHLIPYGRGPRP